MSSTGDLTTPPDVVGTHEVATILGVTRQRVDQLAARPDFPTPRELKRARIWWRLSIIEWASKNRPVSRGDNR